MEYTKEELINNEIIINNKINRTNKIFKSLVIPQELEWIKSKDEYIYLMYNNIKEKPICSNKNCKIKPNFRFFNIGYNKICSKQCPSFNKKEIIIPKKLTKKFIEKNIINKKDLKTFGLKIKKQIKIPKNHFSDNINEYLYSILFNKQEKDKCIVCKKKSTKFKSFKFGYYEYCSKICRYKGVQKKMKKTNIERYGCENASSSIIVKAKRKKTNLKRFGYENPSQNEKIKEKMKKTNIERYGYENPSQNKEVKQKKIKTCLKNYGVKNPNQSKEIQERRKKTNLKKFHFENPSQNEKIKKKKIETTKKNYGVENPFQSEEIKEKIKETNVERYGVDNINKLKIFQKKKQKEYKKRYGVKNNKQLHITNYENYNIKYIQNKFIKDGVLDVYKCLKYFNISLFTMKEIRTKLKYERVSYNKSFHQKEIFDFIKKKLDINNIKYNIYNDKYKIIDNMELDIYIELLKYNDKSKKYEIYKKIAIEYNGLMFHSFGKSKYSKFNNIVKEGELFKEYKNKKYKYKEKHLLKTNMCKDLNIDLLHIFENDWIDKEKKNILKGIILEKIGIYKRIINIEKESYKIKEINYDNNIKIFLNKNSLEQYYNKKENKIIGLFINNILKKCVILRNNEIIVIKRELNTKIVDNKHFFFKKICKLYKGVDYIYIIDEKLLSLKKEYIKKNNFKYKKTIDIDYFYIHKRNVKMKYSKYFIEKNKMKINKVLSFDENMINNEYRRMYDCGKDMFVLKI